MTPNTSIKRKINRLRRSPAAYLERRAQAPPPKDHHMPSPLSPHELAELQVTFADPLNYESEDPREPNDPLTYCAPDKDNCLHIAAHRGNLRIVELLVKAGLDVSKQGDMGHTPLHYAATPEIIAFLLTHGASPSIKNEFGTSPVGWEAER